MKNVDEYIAKAPSELRAILNGLREVILSAAPKSQEKISYGMPYSATSHTRTYERLKKL